MEFTNIILEKKDHIAKITLNRPEALNAIDPTTYMELHAAAEDIEADDEIRVVIITGKGRAFCAGADLKAIRSILGHADQVLKFLEGCHRAYNAIENLSVPVIAAVNGIALAGGIELVEACDIVIASETAQLGDQHANFGLVAGGGGTQRLTRQIGFKKAKELLLTGDWLSAKEAEALGLVNKVVPADKLEEAANEMAQKLAKKSPMASKCIKMLANKGIQADLYTGLQMEISAVAAHFLTEDFAEGLKAFDERREPHFPGR